MTGTPATSFNEREHQICFVAVACEDARTYWGGGRRLADGLDPAGQKLYAPKRRLRDRGGVVNPEPMLSRSTR